MPINRRQFVQHAATIVAGISLGAQSCSPSPKKALYEISLAEWSLHKSLFSNKISNLDFPVIAKQQYGIGIVEYVNQFFKDKAADKNYLNDLLKRSSDNGVRNRLIMIDREGDIGDLDAAKRNTAVENHFKWIDAAKHLGCTAIRINAFGGGDKEEVKKAAVEAITKLAAYGQTVGIEILVENHGGYSSDGQWLSSLVKSVGKPNVGTMADFTNFCVARDSGDLYNGKCIEEYDKYKGVEELMPYAKGVSAKAFDFDAKGNCIETDYEKMFGIIKKSGYKGIIGLEYEGETLSEDEGIRKTKALLDRMVMGD